ncbi:PAAR domain-containing protein [Acinetobacter sp. NIPH 2699]|uniref:PAAR domain-containing protein n=1 Tax=Acinetobacter sp. NIPH 2699 TaxID=2923433 RepID=UPI001F4B3550|nr:PAAR domain-containing protein [Acinetobacter sp. NIPH 2699]MCH7335186.1 PAAR domain-containing protein [Acinetobacter sp. NIPH 2699]
MATAYIVVGCPTTGGGNVITGSSFFLIEGIPIACVGDKATCPKHQTVATIITGDPHMQVMGKMAARVNDSLSCGCKLLPKQNLVVQDNGGGNSSASSATSSKDNHSSFLNPESFGHRFQLKDQLTGNPLSNICYEIEKNGEIIHGTTDDQGFTELVTNKSAEEVTISIIYEEHQHG